MHGRWPWPSPLSRGIKWLHHNWYLIRPRRPEWCTKMSFDKTYLAMFLRRRWVHISIFWRFARSLFIQVQNNFKGRATRWHLSLSFANCRLSGACEKGWVEPILRHPKEHCLSLNLDEFHFLFLTLNAVHRAFKSNYRTLACAWLTFASWQVIWTKYKQAVYNKGHQLTRRDPKRHFD